MGSISAQSVPIRGSFVSSRARSCLSRTGRGVVAEARIRHIDRCTQKLGDGATLPLGSASRPRPKNSWEVH